MMMVIIFKKKKQHVKGKKYDWTTSISVRLLLNFNLWIRVRQTDR